MLVANPLARRTPYDAPLRALLNLDAAREGRRWLAHWPDIRISATPTWSLPGLARRNGVDGLFVKDESFRSELGSFKALGAPVALLRLILRIHPDRGFLPKNLLAGRHASELKDFAVISATDGNHGRALAAAARSVGCRCAIVLHAQVSPEREAAIAALGAEILHVSGRYDDSVREAGRLAAVHGWHLVSDTSHDGYETIPRDVMQGYAILAEELMADAVAFTHVILQGGVGGLAAGVVSAFWERDGPDRPCFIVVEPEQADCLLQSARTGRPAAASGSVDSIMAGLACGQASPLAWRFLAPAVDFFLTVSDAEAVAAMRTIAQGEAGDIPILSGESGAAGLAALQSLAATPSWRHQVGFGSASSILLINTEGATAPETYERLVGPPPRSVQAAQAAWLRDNPEFSARRDVPAGAFPSPFPKESS
jgi:diaminopropionate ammonia-lyase family